MELGLFVDLCCLPLHCTVGCENILVGQYFYGLNLEASVFDPILAQLGPIAVLVLFLALAGAAMAPALSDVLGRVLPVKLSTQRLVTRFESERRALQLWLRAHGPCAAVAGWLGAGRGRP